MALPPAPWMSFTAWTQPFLRATSFFYAVGNFTIPAFLFVVLVVARRHGLTGGEIGILLALWTLSGAMQTVMWALNAAYERDETRGFVKKRLVASLRDIDLAGELDVEPTVTGVTVDPQGKLTQGDIERALGTSLVAASA